MGDMGVTPGVKWGGIRGDMGVDMGVTSGVIAG